MSLWYMRDNHTFRKLPFDAESAMDAVREEFDDGYTHGMLCSKMAPGEVHAHGKDEWFEFDKQARDWLAKSIACISEQER